jgi:hypothetical protein
VAKRRLALSTGPVTGSIWGVVELLPPYRSYPHPPTELEQLAVRMGIGDEELRQLLRDAIERRLERAFEGQSDDHRGGDRDSGHGEGDASDK